MWVNLRFTHMHVSGHPSAAGRAQDRESSPVEDQRSTTVPRNQPYHNVRWHRIPQLRRSYEIGDEKKYNSPCHTPTCVYIGLRIHMWGKLTHVSCKYRSESLRFFGASVQFRLKRSKQTLQWCSWTPHDTVSSNCCFTARYYAQPGICCRKMSVRPSVCHTPAFYPNGWTKNFIHQTSGRNSKR